MAVMGQLMAAMNDNTTTNTMSRHRAKDRQRVTCSFRHQGKQICEKMFRFLHTIGETRYKNLKSFQSHGLATQSHGNLKRSPAHALSLSATEFIARFLLNYAEQNALLLPGRVPGYSRSDIKLLPSSVSKRGIWKVYQEAARRDDSMRAVGYSTFTGLWRSLLPSVILMKPMTDLCWQCQKGSTVIQRSANLSDEEKSEQYCLHKSTSELCKRSDRFTRLPVKSAPGLSRRTFRPLLLSLHLLLPVTFLPTLTPSKSTIALTTHSRFILMIQKSICWYMYDFICKNKLHLFHITGALSLRPHAARSHLFSDSEEVLSVEYTARQYLARSTSLLTSLAK